MVRITAIITLTGGIVLFLFNIYYAVTYSLNNNEDKIYWFLCMIYSLTSIIYAHLTKYGNIDHVQYKVERENKLLKSKIEQKKLRKELEGD